MYRRGDPRWNRTLQNISDTVEHANESAQEGLYSFTHAYVNPCLSSLTRCVEACTAPCFPSHNDRRRHRARSRGRAESSFDFYDDWDDDENDGLLGWGNDNLDRLWGTSTNYGTVSQPARQRAMSYGSRNRDTRFHRTRRKSAVQPHDGGPDPTIIPSSSYFGFLGRLPFNVGGKVLRYRPSAADLTEHPGQSRGSHEDTHPLLEENEEADGADENPADAGERKGHGRKRSQTSASGHTTDSLSSRGDIFPSEDELDDAIPLDDEFAVALERRTTGQAHDDITSATSRARSASKSKRPAVSPMSTNTYDSGRKSHQSAAAMSPTWSTLRQEEELLRQQEEAEIEHKRIVAYQLAVKRGLTTDQHGPTNELESGELFMPSPEVDTQTMPDSSSFHVDDSEHSSLALTPNRRLSLDDEPRDMSVVSLQSNFVPARLPHFDSQPD